MRITITNGAQRAADIAYLDRANDPVFITEIAAKATTVYERFRKRSQRKGLAPLGNVTFASSYWEGYQDGAKEALEDIVNEL